MSEKKITIAIVEDEEKDMNLLLEYLDDFFRDKEQKAKILIYRDGLELLTAYQEGISLIFLDIQMNQVDGLTTAREIRKIDEDVLIVFTTNLYQLAVRGCHGSYDGARSGKLYCFAGLIEARTLYIVMRI